MKRILFLQQILQGIFWLCQFSIVYDLFGLINSILLLMFKVFQIVRIQRQCKSQVIDQVFSLMVLILMSILAQYDSLQINRINIIFHGIFIGLYLFETLEQYSDSLTQQVILLSTFSIQFTIFGALRDNFLTYLNIFQYTLSMIMLVGHLVDHKPIINVEVMRRSRNSIIIQNTEKIQCFKTGTFTSPQNDNLNTKRPHDTPFLDNAAFGSPSYISVGVPRYLELSSSKRNEKEISFNQRANSCQKQNQSFSAQHIFSLMPQACIILNRKKQIVFFNGKAEKLLKTSIGSEILKELRLIFFQTNLLNHQQVQRKRQQSIARNTAHTYYPNTLNQSQFDQLLKLKLCNQIPDYLEIFDFLLDPCNPEIVKILNERQSAREIQIQMLNSNNSLDGQNSTLIYEQEYFQQQSQKNLKLQIQIIQGEFGSQENELDLLDQRMSQESSKYNIIIMIDDITKKRNYIEVQNRLKFQHDILLSFSHELRTPLNCSIQLLNVAQDVVSHEVYQNLIRPAQNSNLLLLYQINDILDYAAFETKDFKYNFTTFKFQEVILELQDLFELAMRQKKLSFDITINFSLIEQEICFDKLRLIQVIRSLILNSMKFTHNGGFIELFFKKCQSQNVYEERYKIGLRDDGIGMSDSQISIMQDLLMKQTKNKLKEFEVQGNKQIGLGFKISNRIVSGFDTDERPNYLRLKRLQQGLQVHFFIEHKRQNKNNNRLYQQGINQSTPLVSCANFVKSLVNFDHLEEEIQLVKINKSPLLMKNNLQQCNCKPILIVDDEPFNQLALKQMLKSYRLLADEAYDGQQAIDQVKFDSNKSCCNISYKIIIMDIQMPIKDGIQSSYEISLFNKQMNIDRRPAIIMSSAFDTKNNIEQAQQIGIVDFLNKPIRRNQLEDILNKYNLL